MLKIENQTAAHMEQVPCNICGGRDFSKFISLNDRRLEGDQIFQVVRCKKCGLLQTNPRPTRKGIAQYYTYDYWPFNRIKVPERRRPLHSLWRRFSLRVNQADAWVLHKMNGRILDVGCGSGEYFDLLLTRGWHCFGVEPNINAAAIARARGAEVYEGTIESLALKPEFFDVVTMRHSLEHLHDPKSSLLKIGRSLRINGLLLIGVPNYQSPQARIFKTNWAGWDLPRHLYHFDAESLKSLLSTCGFKVIHLEYESWQMIGESLNLLTRKRLQSVLRTGVSLALLDIVNLILKKALPTEAMMVIASK